MANKPNQAKLSMVRGDTFAFSVAMVKDGTPIPFKDGDKVYFTVKRSGLEKHSLISKTVSTFEANGSAAIHIEPKDTKDIAFGTYVYDIELITRAGAVSTIVPCSQFIIGIEVTDNGY